MLFIFSSRPGSFFYELPARSQNLPPFFFFFPKCVPRRLDLEEGPFPASAWNVSLLLILVGLLLVASACSGTSEVP